jgi:thymidylate kinase
MFVNIEGVDCSGKTTIMSLLSKYIDYTTFQSPLPPITKIKTELFDNWSHIARMFIFLGSNLEISLRISEALKSSSLIIIERYIWTTFAYHIALGVISRQQARDLFMVLKERYLMPNIVVCLQVDRETQLIRARNRIEGKLQHTLLNSNQFQDELRLAYTYVSTWAQSTWVMVDSTDGDSEYITKKILALINSNEKE